MSSVLPPPPPPQDQGLNIQLISQPPPTSSSAFPPSDPTFGSSFQPEVGAGSHADPGHHNFNPQPPLEAQDASSSIVFLQNGNDYFDEAPQLAATAPHFTPAASSESDVGQPLGNVINSASQIIVTNAGAPVQNQEMGITQYFDAPNQNPNGAPPPVSNFASSPTSPLDITNSFELNQHLPEFGGAPEESVTGEINGLEGTHGQAPLVPLIFPQEQSHVHAQPGETQIADVAWSELEGEAALGHPEMQGGSVPLSESNFEGSAPTQALPANVGHDSEHAAQSDEEHSFDLDAYLAQFSSAPPPINSQSTSTAPGLPLSNHEDSSTNLATQVSEPLASAAVVPQSLVLSQQTASQQISQNVGLAQQASIPLANTQGAPPPQSISLAISASDSQLAQHQVLVSTASDQADTIVNDLSVSPGVGEYLWAPSETAANPALLETESVQLESSGVPPAQVEQQQISTVEDGEQPAEHFQSVYPASSTIYYPDLYSSESIYQQASPSQPSFLDGGVGSEEHESQVSLQATEQASEEEDDYPAFDVDQYLAQAALLLGSSPTYQSQTYAPPTSVSEEEEVEHHVEQPNEVVTQGEFHPSYYEEAGMMQESSSSPPHPSGETQTQGSEWALTSYPYSAEYVQNYDGHAPILLSVPMSSDGGYYHPLYDSAHNTDEPVHAQYYPDYYQHRQSPSHAQASGQPNPGIPGADWSVASGSMSADEEVGDVEWKSEERARPMRPMIGRPSALGLAPSYSYSGGKLSGLTLGGVGEDSKFLHGSHVNSFSQNHNGTLSFLVDSNRHPHHSLMPLGNSNTVYNSLVNDNKSFLSFPSAGTASIVTTTGNGSRGQSPGPVITTLIGMPSSLNTFAGSFPSSNTSAGNQSDFPAAPDAGANSNSAYQNYYYPDDSVKKGTGGIMGNVRPLEEPDHNAEPSLIPQLELEIKAISESAGSGGNESVQTLLAEDGLRLVKKHSSPATNSVNIGSNNSSSHVVKRTVSKGHSGKGKHNTTKVEVMPVNVEKGGCLDDPEGVEGEAERVNELPASDLPPIISQLAPFLYMQPSGSEALNESRVPGGEDVTQSSPGSEDDFQYTAAIMNPEVIPEGEVYFDQQSLEGITHSSQATDEAEEPEQVESFEQQTPDYEDRDEHHVEHQHFLSEEQSASQENDGPVASQHKEESHLAPQSSDGNHASGKPVQSVNGAGSGRPGQASPGSASHQAPASQNKNEAPKGPPALDLPEMPLPPSMIELPKVPDVMSTPDFDFGIPDPNVALPTFEQDLSQMLQGLALPQLPVLPGSENKKETSSSNANKNNTPYSGGQTVSKPEPSPSSQGFEGKKGSTTNPNKPSQTGSSKGKPGKKPQVGPSSSKVPNKPLPVQSAAPQSEVTDKGSVVIRDEEQPCEDPAAPLAASQGMGEPADTNKVPAPSSHAGKAPGDKSQVPGGITASGGAEIGNATVGTDESKAQVAPVATLAGKSTNEKSKGGSNKHNNLGSQSQQDKGCACNGSKDEGGSKGGSGGRKPTSNKHLTPQPAELEVEEQSDVTSVRPPKPTRPKRPSRPNTNGNRKPKPSKGDSNTAEKLKGNGVQLQEAEEEEEGLELEEDNELLSQLVEESKEKPNRNVADKAAAAAEEEEEEAEGPIPPAEYKPLEVPIKQTELFGSVPVFGWEIPVVNWQYFTDLFHSFFMKKFRMDAHKLQFFQCDEADDAMTTLRSELDVNYLCGDDSDLSRTDVTSPESSNVCNIFCHTHGLVGGKCLPHKTCLCYMTEERKFGKTVTAFTAHMANCLQSFLTGLSKRS